MRLVAIEQMPEFGILRCFRTAVWLLFETQDGFLKAPVPFEGGVGVLCIDGVKDERKIALRAGRDVNEVGHAAFRILRGTPSPAAPFLPSRPPGPGGFLQSRRPERLYPEVADRPRRPVRWPQLSP